MTSNPKNETAAGAKHVEEQEHLTAGTEPAATTEAAKPLEGQSTRTNLGTLSLSMFTKGQYVRVRVGDPHNATELYEHAYASADEANTALLDAGILTQAQVPDPTALAGTGIVLHDVTAEALEAAGLKRHLSSSL